MNTQSLRRPAVVAVALLAAFAVLLQADTAQADKPKKMRGVIVSVDLEARTMIIKNPTKEDKPHRTVEWIDGVEMKPGKKEVTDLKPGVYVRCMINDEGKARTIRIYDEIPE